MKRIVGIMLLLFVTMSASAQMWGHSAHGNSFGYGGNSSDSYLSTGYRGMVEMGHGAGSCGGDYLFKLSTTHGYQFNPYIYLGGFVSFGTTEVWEQYRYYYSSWDYIYNERYEPNFNFRLGADFRAYLPKGRIAPFAGVQLGFDYGSSTSTYSGDYAFVYFSGQIGLRVALNNRMGLNAAFQVGSEDYFEGCELLFKLGYEF